MWSQRTKEAVVSRCRWRSSQCASAHLKKVRPHVSYTMGKYRARFNEKARSGMLAKQAALKRARNKHLTRGHETSEAAEAPPAAAVEQDPNSEMLMPMTQAEKDERKRTLTESLYSENKKEGKLSRAKRKRLDKYIEHQIKREEKKVLLEKLAHTQIDTSIMAPSKLLGAGKQTRREEMAEALLLEKQGRADERTRDILYEERVVKDWDASGLELLDSAPEPEPRLFVLTDAKSSLIDYRPRDAGGAGFGFGFSNIPKIEKSAPKKKYTWRLKLEQEAKKKAKADDENDFILSDDDAEASAATPPGSDDSDSGRPAKARLSRSTRSDLEDSQPDVDESDAEGVDEDTTDSDLGETSGGLDSAEGESEESEESEIGEDGEDSEDNEENEDGQDGEDSGEESESEEDNEVPRLLQNKPSHSDTAKSFKEWAEEQVRKLEGRNEMVLPELSEDIHAKYARGVHDKVEISDDDNGVQIDENLQRAASYVTVTRPVEVQQLRMQLPVFSEEHRIMEAIHHHDIIVLCGETGSGKTTQVPQFLYESGYGDVHSPTTPGMIGVTQPRRVAAVSMAKRVASELGEVHGKRVGYQIRFDSTIQNEGQENGTALKFMTDGVLLREMMKDFMLEKYSVLIIDEAHERNVNTDILIGMLSRVVKLRRGKSKPLKLVIMSATLRVSDFSENKQLFAVPPPIVQVEARQYPVSVHFNKKTRPDYIEEAFKKSCKIHKRLPPGGILVFLTGQNEINTVVRKLRKEFPFRNNKPHLYDLNDDTEYRASNNVTMEAEDVDLEIALRERAAEELESESENDSEDEEGFDETLEDHQSETDPLYVLPLYSLLPTKQQMKVFENPPPGSRLCIVATNVAETSLTIPGIRYVVDCGRSKERKYDEETGVQSFEVDWVSKASAGQRAGRAGRTGPGHCYRLYSSAIYEEYFEQFSKPEILRMPVESTVLTMKSMGIDHIVNFPFPTPPDRSSLYHAEKLLATLGALDRENKQITDLGRTMSHFPLSPRFAKVLIVGNQLNCLPYVIAIVSAMSVGDPFRDEQELGLVAAPQPKKVRKAEDSDAESPEDEEDVTESPADVEMKRKLRSKFYKSRAIFSRLDASSDALKLLSAVCALDHVPAGKRDEFIQDNFMRHKLVEEIQKLRMQIANIVSANVTDGAVIEELRSRPKLGVPSKQQVAAMKQIIASGFVDQVAIRSDVIDSDIKISSRTNVISVAYSTISPVTSYGDDMDSHVYIHPTSILADSGATPPQYLVYQTLSKSSNHKEGTLGKLRMKPIVDVDGKQLANLAKSSHLITYSKPLGHPYGPKNITSTKRECYVIPRYGAALGDGGLGWDLPVVKVIQVKKNGLWVIEGQAPA